MNVSPLLRQSNIFPEEAPDNAPTQPALSRDLFKSVFQHFSDTERLEHWTNTRCSTIRERLEKGAGFGDILHRHRQQRLQITRDAEKDWGHENSANTDRVLQAIEQLPPSQQLQPLLALMKKYTTWHSNGFWPVQRDLAPAQFKKMAFLVTTSLPQEKSLWKLLTSLTRRLPPQSIKAALEHLLPALTQDNGWSPLHKQEVLHSLMQAIPNKNPPQGYWDCILTAFDKLPSDQCKDSLKALMQRIPGMNADLAHQATGKCLRVVHRQEKALDLLFHLATQCAQRQDSAGLLDCCSTSIAIPYSAESLVKKLMEKNPSAQGFLQSLLPDVRKIVKDRALFLQKMALKGIASQDFDRLAESGRHYLALYPPEEWMSVLERFHEELQASPSKDLLFSYMEKLKKALAARK
ncbi:hypothetical protein [Hydrogenophaga sp. ANAO-22]|jgi:hypothetical protein|uniref:hypothetical protein n=1 Tax=Hydrogenophaga sp. ANAO-22 TaxID=3166645 RepID=UPI0036D38C00